MLEPTHAYLGLTAEETAAEARSRPRADMQWWQALREGSVYPAQDALRNDDCGSAASWWRALHAIANNAPVDDGDPSFTVSLIQLGLHAREQGCDTTPPPEELADIAVRFIREKLGDPSPSDAAEAARRYKADWGEIVARSNAVDGADLLRWRRVKNLLEPLLRANVDAVRAWAAIQDLP